MDASEKRDMLTQAAKEYIYYENENKLWQREPSAAYTYAKGKLIGMCMAFELEIKEDSKKVTLFFKTGRKYISINK